MLGLRMGCHVMLGPRHLVPSLGMGDPVLAMSSCSARSAKRCTHLSAKASAPFWPSFPFLMPFTRASASFLTSCHPSALNIGPLSLVGFILGGGLSFLARSEVRFPWNLIVTGRWGDKPEL